MFDRLRNFTLPPAMQLIALAAAPWSALVLAVGSLILGANMAVVGFGYTFGLNTVNPAEFNDQIVASLAITYFTGGIGFVAARHLSGTWPEADRVHRFLAPVVRFSANLALALFVVLGAIAAVNISVFGVPGSGWAWIAPALFGLWGLLRANWKHTYDEGGADD